ncbi:hypothetical protein V1477_009283 [Vespula maculifrons]|uniref:Uncharacterized protein n=1 Tax=Vespula maculifrons TaxID=7453 RepID=A0ABD2C9B6_VESMC
MYRKRDHANVLDKNTSKALLDRGACPEWTTAAINPGREEEEKEEEKEEEEESAVTQTKSVVS